jgi:hypothetical protein
MHKIEYQMYHVASCFNRVIELKQKMLILSQFATRNVSFLILTIKLNSWITDPFNLNVILNWENKISDVTCFFLFQSCDWTESENVNFINISDDKSFVIVTMTTELFIKYFCCINSCCLWRFNDKMSVIYWDFFCF